MDDTAETTIGATSQKDQRRAFSLFLKAMQSADPATRARAMQLFRSDATPPTQERLIDLLVAALDSGVQARREAAAATLAAIGWPALLPLTMHFLHCRKPARRRQAVEVLGAICLAHLVPPGFALARALEDRDPDVRRAAEGVWRALRAAHEERDARLRASTPRGA